MKQTELKRKTPLRANPAKPLRAKAPLKASGTPRKAAKPRKPKVESLATLRRQCDELCSLIVRRNGENRCVVCGKTERPTNGHVFSRRASETRWDTHQGGNCYVQCVGCNFNHERDRYPYFDWYVSKFGYESFKELRRRYDTTLRMNKTTLREIRDRLKKEWNGAVL